jgi:hypothetical protein
MVPSMNPSDPAPFYQLDSEPFEGLCRDLFSREHGIASCDIYGVRGQSQLGVDLKAQRDDEYACEVAQCKCCEDFGPALIRNASEEFLKHLDVWRERNVRRYILIVASPLDRKGQQDEIDRQVELFSSLGIRYEACRRALSPRSSPPTPTWSGDTPGRRSGSRSSAAARPKRRRPLPSGNPTRPGRAGRRRRWSVNSKPSPSSKSSSASRPSDR